MKIFSTSIYLLFLFSFFFHDAKSQNNDCNKVWLHELEKKTVYDYSSDFEIDMGKKNNFHLPSDKQVEFNFKFESDFMYSIILIADPDAKASGIEIKDKFGKSMGVASVYRKSLNNIVIFSFDPQYDDNYSVLATSIYKKISGNCAELFVLKIEKKKLFEINEGDK